MSIFALLGTIVAVVALVLQIAGVGGNVANWLPLAAIILVGLGVISKL